MVGLFIAKVAAKVVGKHEGLRRALFSFAL
jgi:hypothetical protein